MCPSKKTIKKKFRHYLWEHENVLLDFGFGKNILSEENWASEDYSTLILSPDVV